MNVPHVDPDNMVLQIPHTDSGVNILSTIILIYAGFAKLAGT
jgi:hypothetical protein